MTSGGLKLHCIAIATFSNFVITFCNTMQFYARQMQQILLCCLKTFSLHKMSILLKCLSIFVNRLFMKLFRTTNITERIVYKPIFKWYLDVKNSLVLICECLTRPPRGEILRQMSNVVAHYSCLSKAVFVLPFILTNKDLYFNMCNV